MKLQAIPLPRESIRWWIAVGTTLISAAAITAYIIAVNAIMLDGEAIRRVSVRVTSLEREHALLQNHLIARQAPASLRAMAAIGRMVEAEGVRYLTAGQPVALSSRP